MSDTMTLIFVTYVLIPLAIVGIAVLSILTTYGPIWPFKR